MLKKLDEHITAKPRWDKSAAQIWDERFAALTEEADQPGTAAEGKGRVVRMKPWLRYAMSAAAVALILLSATAWLFTKTYQAQPGQVSEVRLPDGSVAQVSSRSEVSYRPLLWMVSPKVQMEGEVYFSGHHASGFTVRTEQGDIEVMGTSFNVKSYDGVLNVACISGRVNVKGPHSSVILKPSMEATLSGGRLTSATFSDEETVMGWTKGVFSYNNKPLRDVLKDVSRYYDVRIAAPAGIDSLRYSGRFTRSKSVDDVLAIIGSTYGITLTANR